MGIMTLVIFGLNVITALISCAAAVIAVSYARKPASIQMQQDVDELGAIVEKLMKDQRRERMRNVRAAAKTGDNDHSEMPVPEVVAGQTPADKKSALRQRLQQLRGGN